MTAASRAGPHPAHPGRLRDEPPTDDERSRIVPRPDGFYWVADDGHQEFGPFATALEAMVALRAGIETGLEPDETLQQAEDEVGYVPPALDDQGRPEE